MTLKKRALFHSFKKSKGSMAFEGSLVLPIFLFFMMTVLLSLESVRFQCDVQEAMHQAGNWAAFEDYRVKYAGIERAAASSRIKEYLDHQLYPYLCVAGGTGGVQVQDLSAAGENGQIELIVEYGLRPFAVWLPIGDVRIKDRFFGHSWVGYSGEEGKSGNTKEMYVYITETGSRYHLSYQCTYLGSRPQAISWEDARLIRNASGGKYYPCQRCKPAKGGLVYITEDGQSYHGESDCPALKRTVYMIPLSEAGGYGPCSRCAG